MLPDIVNSTAMAEAEHNSEVVLTKCTPYLTSEGELSSVFC